MRTMNLRDAFRFVLANVCVLIAHPFESKNIAAQFTRRFPSVFLFFFRKYSSTAWAVFALSFSHFFSLVL